MTVAFDGTNIWVTNYSSNNVSKLSASGATLGTFAVGANPKGVAFDGKYIWVANEGGNTITKLQASTGTVVGTFPQEADLMGWRMTGLISGCRITVAIRSRN